MAFIVETFDITMSPVMKVTIEDKSGSNHRAVLKLYDRRFGCDLRDVLGKHARLTSEDEAIFQSFVERGEIGPFLQELEEQQRTELFPPRPHYQLDDPSEGPSEDPSKGQARYEAALWQACGELYDCETKAYARLKDVQGSSIPRLYAHVRLVRFPADVPQDLLQDPQTARYFEIKGILLQLIPGYNLRNIHTSPLGPSDTNMWSTIVQSAVDAAHDINKRGVIMEDCQPRNVMVDQHSHSPFLIDLAQCTFKDDLIELWGTENEEEEEEAEGWPPEVKYWDLVRSRGNHCAIGAVMTKRLENDRGIKLNIQYPNCDKLVEDALEGKQVV
ncbi:hypothetical protein B0T10DRAFT_517592 [Thelonectria olida]|uniref:Protein kinase domain-containing protein n=1 Tax=Thelonectria olida TaxID=1576542 RepID=A0A9P9APP2_9HYPO|nr:hypothetical protein B0T10DRAFT_517592 [Thelonectria olida]